MTTACPTESELLDAALNAPGSGAIQRHVESCGSCREKVRAILQVADVLHSTTASSSSSTAESGCLDDLEIAALAEGYGGSAEAIAHAAGCVTCQGRIAGVSVLMSDSAVKHDIESLESARPIDIRRWSRRRVSTWAGLAVAAGATIVLLGPLRSVTRENGANPSMDQHRDPAITAAIAPLILSPGNITKADDSLRWTAVPQAELYRVRIWTSDGTVVWTAETRDTKVPLPQVIQPGTPYLWEVTARTGWDRWVNSDLAEFKVQPR